MATTSTAFAPLGKRSDRLAAGKPGLFRQILAAIIASRQEKADREVAEIIARRDGMALHELWAEKAGRAHPFAHGFRR